MIRALILLSCLLLVSAAAPTPSETLAASALLEDASVLQTIFTSLHPGLYRYNSPEETAQHFAELRTELTESQSLDDAFLAFSRFTATIRCGHTYPNFFNQPDAIAQALFQGRNRLPFYFLWLGRRMIVTRNFSADPRFRPGTEIVSIDGVSASDILDKLLPFARADGSNDAKRIDELSVQGRDKYEAFDIYYPLVYPHSGATFRVRAQAFSGNRFSAEVGALSYQERVAPIKTSLEATTGNEPLWALQFLRGETAYLKMPTWETYNSKWDWQKSIQATFDALATHATQRLIIDLRGNEGGTEVGDAILAHLVDRPLQTATFERLVRFRTVSKELRPYLNTWDPSFFELGDNAMAVGDNFYRLASEDSTIITPAKPRFSGIVEVLVDASNSSATFQFAYAAQQLRLATLIGSPTGGNLRGINGGAFFFVHLPNSHIEVDLPLIGTFPKQSEPDRGLEPDIRVDQTVESIASGRDLALETALHPPAPRNVQPQSTALPIGAHHLFHDTLRK